MKIFFVIALIAVALVAGCTAQTTNGTNNTSNDNGAVGGERVEVSMRAFQFGFDPATITVNKGDTVVLHITSEDVTHGFAISEFNVNTQIPAGQTVDVEFVADRPGTFRFFCSVICGSGHADMAGQLVVRE